MEEVRQVMESGWLTTGPKAQELEKQFTEFLGVRNAIAVNSCTAAMHLSLEAIGLRSGDFVFTTPYTFAATAEVVRYFGAIPVFVDVQPDTLNIDPVQLADVVEDLDRVLAGKRKPRARSCPCILRAMLAMWIRFMKQPATTGLHSSKTRRIPCPPPTRGDGSDLL
jgi:hypothetical protein